MDARDLQQQRAFEWVSACCQEQHVARAARQEVMGMTDTTREMREASVMPLHEQSLISTRLFVKRVAIAETI